MNSDKTRFPRTGRLAAIALASGTVLLGACSEGTPDRVPLGSSLSISPEENVWLVADRRDAQGRCFVDDSYYVDLPILISLRDGGGVPVGETEIGVYVNLAANTFSGGLALQLFDDLNGNGVVDADTELVSGADDDIARVRTSKHGGARLMLLRTNLSCPYKSDVFAFVDGVSAASSVEVKLACEEADEGCELPEPSRERTGPLGS